VLTGKVERRPRGDLARVLVIDDEADIRELLDLTVARMGLSADCAASVAQARQLLEQQRYQLCLTDMRLPDGEGLEIVRLICGALRRDAGGGDHCLRQCPERGCCPQGRRF
jgi:CheY-like chemotaxis protein